MSHLPGHRLQDQRGWPPWRGTNGVAFLGAVRDTVRSVSLPRDQAIDLLEARSWMNRPAR
ncbi:hypothetical protein F8279_09815 [Micromonospora sp. AMSO1212t]|nr:hypothetical protein F8279_09815 [Micromonospora sp. AMSO1212t]